MKPIRKKTLFFIFLLLVWSFSILTLASCDSQKKDIETTGSSTSDFNEVVLTVDNAKDYMIIMPQGCSAEVSKAAQKLYDTLREQGFEVGECTYDGGNQEINISDDACEILIGETNRSESTEHTKGLRSDDYVISAKGSRIIITGGSSQAIVTAVDHFINTYISKNDTVTISEPFVHCEKSDWVELTVNGVPIYEYRISIPPTANAMTLHAATLLSDTITQQAGYKLRTVKETTPENGNVIRISLSDTLGDYEYSYNAKDGDLNINGTKHTLLYAVRHVINSVNNAKNNALDLNDCAHAGTLTMQFERTPTHPTLEGKLPVALCDQKNAQAVVIDLAADDPTSEDAILWTWSPNAQINGFSAPNFKNRIDEIKLRYSSVLGKYLVCMTSSSGFIGIAEYPSGNLIWEADAAGYSPHSIEYLPNGMVACVLSGSTGNENQEIRLYTCKEDGTINQAYIKVPLTSAHGVVWDQEWGVLWALGGTELVAYEIGGTTERPTLTKINGLGCTVTATGHDLSVSTTEAGRFWISSNNVYVFDKYSNTITTTFEGSDLIGTKSVKSITELVDGRVLRTVAANVYAAHNTDTLDVFQKNASGVYEKIQYVFANRAFYKARPFILSY